MAEQTEPVQRRWRSRSLKPEWTHATSSPGFEAERQALALMDHPNIAQVLDGGATASGRLFFVMECGAGTSHHRLLRPDQT